MAKLHTCQKSAFLLVVFVIAGITPVYADEAPGEIDLIFFTGIVAADSGAQGGTLPTLRYVSYAENTSIGQQEIWIGVDYSKEQPPDGLRVRLGNTDTLEHWQESWRDNVLDTWTVDVNDARNFSDTRGALFYEFYYLGTLSANVIGLITVASGDGAGPTNQDWLIGGSASGDPRRVVIRILSPGEPWEHFTVLIPQLATTEESGFEFESPDYFTDSIEGNYSDALSPDTQAEILDKLDTWESTWDFEGTAPEPSNIGDLDFTFDIPMPNGDSVTLDFTPMTMPTSILQAAQAGGIHIPTAYGWATGLAQLQATFRGVQIIMMYTALIKIVISDLTVS